MGILHEDNIKALFEKWSGETVQALFPLAPSGSNRNYYRIQGETQTAIATYHPNGKENTAFLSYSKHFKSKNIPVPAIYADDLAADIYIQEDLGSTALYDIIQEEDGFSDRLVGLYKSALENLATLQIRGHEGLDYSVAYPRATFDQQSILWDLNYFKYYFLKLTNTAFDEQALEDDFHAFAEYLLGAKHSYFMFRDFQSRNIMIRDEKPYFIDYQGGRKGALQYDVASLLFQAKANIPHPIRQQLLEHYIYSVQKFISIDKKQFTQFYYAYALIRTIQVLGAYGFRGLYERKPHFIQSIPYALANLRWLLENTEIPVSMPELRNSLQALTKSNRFSKESPMDGSESPLHVAITSFSYKKGIPADPSGNGGGFVFDCRFIHNPGRYEPYKQQTGRDAAVIQFLKEKSNMSEVIHIIQQIVDKSVENYIEREFTHLSINFGCTGGQHRSVYAADQIAQHLKEKYGVAISVLHRERGWEKEVL